MGTLTLITPEDEWCPLRYSVRRIPLQDVSINIAVIVAGLVITTSHAAGMESKNPTLPLKTREVKIKYRTGTSILAYRACISRELANRGGDRS